MLNILWIFINHFNPASSFLRNKIITNLWHGNPLTGVLNTSGGIKTAILANKYLYLRNASRQTYSYINEG